LRECSNTDNYCQNFITAVMVIYTKDVQHIIGKTDRTARKLMKAIRKKLGKEKHQMISVHEFCEYTGLPEDEVFRRLEHHRH
jgi:hypothetical protein